MANSSPEGIELGKGSKLESLSLSINKEKVLEIKQQERSYSEEDLECAWNSSEQNMRFTFSSSAYKGIRFKQWLEKFKEEKEL
jgi:hypothetical protein